MILYKYIDLKIYLTYIIPSGKIYYFTEKQKYFDKTLGLTM